MGTWGCRSFENDSALDWVYLLQKHDDHGFVFDALKLINSQTNAILVEPAPTHAIAAAEVIAAILGRPSEDCPASVKTWIKNKSPIPPPIVAQAIQAVQTIQSDSSLKRLWRCQEDLEAWEGVLQDLANRLNGAKKKLEKIKYLDV